MNQEPQIPLRVAIVGMACRVPGARNVDEFWRNLCAGVESIRPLTREEMLAARVDPADLENPRHVAVGALVADVDRFDAPFFGMTAREAELMDPQQRLFLECAWEALEHAGCDPFRFDGAIGVFGGSNFGSYMTENLMPSGVLEDKAATLQAILANDKDYLATRVSYKLNLRGPSLTVQSGCSTSLVATHLASQSLLNFECDMALAGGVSVDVGRVRGYWAHEGSVFSPDGHVRAFDAGARGTVFGNGVAMVVLKRLEDALRDGDTVYAVILGSATNNDGAVKVGFTAPSVAGQSEVIAEALGDAGVQAATIGYVEAHGTGTALGDPIEIEALTKAYGAGRRGVAPCAIGSVKTNVGHLDSAAGATGLIKAALALYHGRIPPSLNYATPNPAIDFDATRFYVNATLAPWHEGMSAGSPRRAGVSSFGMGGTNAHLILEEAPQRERAVSQRPGELLIWSARTASALDAATARLAAHFDTHTDIPLAGVAHTLQAARASFAHRRILVARNLDDAARMLENVSSPRVWTRDYAGEAAHVAFLFPGQVTPGGDLGLQIYESEPLFRREFDACRSAAEALTGRDMGDVLSRSSEAGAVIPVWQADLTLFAVEYALARLWMSWGITPEAMAGSGAGSYAAACVAGVMSTRDAIRLVRQRAELLSRGVPAPDASDQMGKAFEGVRLSPPRIPLVSGATGRWVEAEEATSPHYWAQHLRDAAALATVVGTLKHRGQFTLLDVGPRRASDADAADAGVRAPIIDSFGSDGNESHVTLLEALGRLWLAGCQPDWQGVHGSAPRLKVALPTYPFARNRYWIEPPYDDDEVPSAVASRKKPRSRDWLYVPGWKQLLPANANASPEALAGRWLVLADSGPLADGIIARLQTHVGPEHIVVVLRGTGVRRESPRRYVVNPAAVADYATVLAGLEDEGWRPNRVLHLWGLVSGGDVADRAERTALLDAGFYSVLSLIQALAGRGSPLPPLTITVVTANAVEVVGTEPVAAATAPLLALLRVIPQEHAHVRSACIDLDATAADAPGRVRFHVDAVLAELSDRDSLPLVAYRGTTRWQPTFEAVPSSHASPRSLRERGVYVVVGGLGRIGLSLAAHLARRVGARLALVGKTGLPPRDAWDAYGESSHSTDRVTRRIAAVRQLERSGAEVIVLAADVSRQPDLARVFAETEQRFGRVDGVIWAAGVVDAEAFHPVTALTRAECERQFAPKIDGLLALAEVLRTRTLDFCLITSSLSSVLGGLGYGAYASANAFMDSFVRTARHGGRTPWVAVDWDAWRFTEIGSDVAGAVLARLAMTPDEASEVFDHVLAIADLPQVVVSTSSLDARMRVWVGDVGARGPSVRALEVQEDALAITEAAAARPAVQSPEEEVAGVRTPSSTEDIVLRVWRQVLGVRSIDASDSFLDAGGSSLTAVQAISRLEEALGVKVAIEEFIFQTASQLATLCEQRRLQQQEVVATAPVAPARGLFRTLRSAIAGRS